MKAVLTIEMVFKAMELREKERSEAGIARKSTQDSGLKHCNTEKPGSGVRTARRQREEQQRQQMSKQKDKRGSWKPSEESI